MMTFCRYNYCFFVIVGFILIPSTFGLKCFQCNSAENPECATLKSNDTDSPYLKDCELNHHVEEPFCRKITTKVLDGENVRVMRTCGWILDESALRNDTCKNKDSDYVLRTSCYCFSDTCNGSAPFSLVPLWVLLVASLVQATR